ncbi:hypothetical protein BO85DRAFT_491931 [Aspergillus piperis CBS 112811]|uniref:Uncharacterized protein n=1 Tax=Aspergillus piperis CBS 112811 TaxID=1448313 RepID=A0A8G1QUH3_9EURO|nr:hypothetical protein BO85DRAFT_491931 [Aspergillus piperis CBS 112811]RAH53807.1 hypothetical protein BO85DRAFT_491931 [Aspergillus piperis CBS 112811]
MSNDIKIVCAENIAISHLLRNVAAPPSSNRTHCPPALRRRSTLSFDTERKLAGALAFIAHIKDDAENIPALGLEEDPESGSLNVIFAVNKASHNDGEDAICGIKQGFERIFAILTTVSGSTRYRDIECQILTAVVSMCSSRILSRLRLAFTSSTTAKRPFKGTLQEALLAVKIVRRKLNNEDFSKTADNFTLRAKEVEKLLDSWSQYQVDTRLVKVVEGIHRLQQTVGLPDLIGIIPNQDMSPSARKSLLNIVNKVGRYWEVARYLYRTAKKLPLARAMRTIAVRLPEEAFASPIIKDYFPELQSKIAETSSKGSQQKLLREICAILKISQQHAIDRYSGQVIRTLREAKIHAEIQLIAHCELERPKLLPRVICSSKDACFLCNLCLQLYQKIYTPKSHGRLYPSWRIPCIPQLAELEQRFSQTLGDHFRETCVALLSTRQKVIYPDPNESTLFTLPLSKTTASASTSSKATRADARISRLPESSKSVGVSDPRTQDTADSKRDTPPDSPSPSHDCAKTIEELNYSEVVQGSKIFGCLTPGESSNVYIADSLRSLEIQIEHATGSNDLKYYMKWLGAEEAAEVRENGSSTQVVDAEHLEGMVALHEQNSLYLVAKDAILKVGWASGDKSLPV